MEEFIVRDLMVPIADYATVSGEATLLDAVLTLEKAQEGFDNTRYRHRAVLVLDESGKVIGKLSQLDAIRALEPGYEDAPRPSGMARYGFSSPYIEMTQKGQELWETPLDHICQKIVQRRVKEFMYTPNEEEYVTEETSLDKAIHQIIIGKHQSLLVMQDDSITGVLRLTDVFGGVFQIIKDCSLST